MKKMLLMTTALVLAGSAYAAPISGTVGVALEINDTLTINASSTNLDMGDVVVTAGEVESPKSTLTVSGNDTSQSVVLSVPNTIELTSAGGAKLEFLTSLDGADGSSLDNGTDLEWTSTNPFATAGSSWIVDFGGKLSLSGTEASGDYAGTATITADYN